MVTTGNRVVVGMEYLAEGLKGAVPFMADRSKPFVSENKGDLVVTNIPGRFSICDCVNGNRRRYPKSVWEKNLAEDSALRQSISRNAAFGLLEHPKDGQISHNSPICILVTDAKLVEVPQEGGNTIHEVHGAISVLNTPEGQRLKALIEAGYNPLVSSRGFGTVTADSEGIDVVQDDYVCEGWDVVMKPSFEKAEVWAHGESRSEGKEAKEEAKDDDTKTVTEAQLKEEKQDLKETAAPSTAAAGAVDSAQTQLTEQAMDIKDIKTRIGAMRAESVPTDPSRFATGMNEMAQLHQEVANYVAEDAKRSWQGQQLHDEIKAIESTWSESAQAPARKASKLTEDYTKVLRVTKAIGETAVGLKKKLSEALQQRAEAAELVEELTNRGQGWVKLAEERKGTIEELEYKLNVACEALDIVAETYWKDTTDLGRRVIEMEFADRAKEPEIAEALKEAKMPKDIIAIREKLEGKKESKEESKSTNEEKEEKDDDDKEKCCPKCKCDPCECKEESKDDSKKETTEAKDDKKDVKESKDEEKKEEISESEKLEERVLVPSVRTVSESVDMVKRLSASAK